MATLQVADKPTLDEIYQKLLNAGGGEKTYVGQEIKKGTAINTNSGCIVVSTPTKAYYLIEGTKVICDKTKVIVYQTLGEANEESDGYIITSNGIAYIVGITDNPFSFVLS